MNITYKTFGELTQFAPTDVAYAERHPKLLQFAKYSPDLDAFARVIKDKALDKIDRKLLVRVLQEQYAALDAPRRMEESIELLQDVKTFTITTAHQPVLFTGPIYVIYKIVSAIKLARKLAEVYPTHHFVPVFVTGGEDHDFEEMNHTHLFGNRIEWEGESGGPVGHMSTTSLPPSLAVLQSLLGSSEIAQEIYQQFEKVHNRHEKYGAAFQDLICGLFSSMGLVVLNMDHPDLKRRMIPIFKDELLQNHSSHLVRKTQSALEHAGFRPQAYVRDINLFYMDDGVRARIERVDDQFEVVDTGLSFTEEEMLRLLEESPEKISPNVVMRPLYQEMILPNLAYVGGGGEIAYWLERRSQFEHFDINYPMLIRRDSYLWIPDEVTRRMQKLEWHIDDFIKPWDDQVKEFVSRSAENEFKLGAEKGQIMQIFKRLEEKANQIEPTLRSTVAAEARNQIKVLNRIEDKLRKAEKQKHETALGQLKKIRSKLFPNEGLQERTVNFLDFYLRQPDTFFDTLFEASDPLDMRLKILH